MSSSKPGRINIILMKCLLTVLMAVLLLPAGVFAGGRRQSTEADGRTFYFAVDDSIYRMNSKTGSRKLIKKFGKPYYISNVNYHNGYLYFSGNYYKGSDTDETYICRVKTDGTGFKKLDSGYFPRVYNGRIYYIRSKITRDSYNVPLPKKTGVASMTLSGTGKKTIIAFSSQNAYSRGLAIIGGRLFYTLSGNLYSASLTGEPKKSFGKCESFVTDGAAIWYQDSSYIYKVTCGGTKTKLFARHKKNGSPVTSLLCVKYGSLYLCDQVYSGTSKFWKYDLTAKKTTAINSFNVVGMSFGSANYIVVYRYLGNGNLCAARLTTSGKSYQVIQKYFRS